MSRFSFRAYHKNAGRYLEGGYDLSCKIGLNSFGELVSGDPAIIIEQSTGHLAYQKLEMLEGDIVRCMEDNLIFEIAWRGCGLVAICKAPGTNNDGMIRDIPDWSWEIIGNVHEEAK